MPPTYKLCLLGPSGAGKTSFAHAVCSRRADQDCHPTRQPVQMFCQLTHEQRGVIIELIDTPPADSTHALSTLLSPLLWYERMPKDVTPTDPLCVYGGREPNSRTEHAIAQPRKLMGFLVVSDVCEPFEPVHQLIDAIFARCSFSEQDAMRAPVAIVIVGTKADLRSRRAIRSDIAMRAELRGRYGGSVGYVETSALGRPMSCEAGSAQAHKHKAHTHARTQYSHMHTRVAQCTLRARCNAQCMQRTMHHAPCTCTCAGEAALHEAVAQLQHVPQRKDIHRLRLAPRPRFAAERLAITMAIRRLTVGPEREDDEDDDAEADGPHRRSWLPAWPLWAHDAWADSWICVASRR